MHMTNLQVVARQIGYDHLTIANSTRRISEYMNQADVAVTSGGRTVLELAALRVPTVVICQNHREMTHTFASSENGVLNLGFRGDLTDAEIAKVLARVLTDDSLRRTMREKMLRFDLSAGKQRVVSIIETLLKEKS
jgi:spore coat polysaccharide biosynthesis predicted glycosyltransferase SpsG